MTDAESPACAFTGNAVVPLDQLRPNPEHPRTDTTYAGLADLMHSVEELGMLQPILVREDEDGGYRVVAGERRRIAAERAGLEEVPIAFPADAEAPDAIFALAQNGTQLAPNPVETAFALQKLVDAGYSQGALAEMIGKSRSAVANLLRLVWLEESVLKYVRSGQLSEGAARAVLMTPGDQRGKLAQQAVERGLSVRSIERLARRLANENWEQRADRHAAWSERDSAARDLASGIGRALGGVTAKARTSTSNEGGVLIIEWDDLVQLQGIAAFIGARVSREIFPNDDGYVDHDEDEEEDDDDGDSGPDLELPTEQEVEYAIRTGDVSHLLETHALNLLRNPPAGPGEAQTTALAREYLIRQGRAPPI